MDAKRYSQVEALFNQCCDLAPDERDALLNNACAGDNELRNAVENLLRHDRDTQQFDEDRKVGAMAAASPNAQFTFALVESDDNSTFTAVSGDDMVTSPNAEEEADVSSGVFFTADSDNDSQVVRVTYKGTKRYARVNIGIADEPSATPIAIMFVAEPELAPVDA